MRWTSLTAVRRVRSCSSGSADALEAGLFPAALCAQTAAWKKAPMLGTNHAKSIFTPRQQTVIDLLRAGNPNKIIAYKLEMRVSTAKVHIRNLMKLLKARNRTEVAYLADAFQGAE